MTLNKLTDQIIEAVRPEIHDDDVLDRRLIKDLINQQRAVWVRNELNKNRDIPEQLIQNLGCVDVQPASTIECCDFSSGCKVMRTVNKIPTPISLHHREAIERVADANSTSKPFTIKDYKEAIFFGNGRFSQHMIAAYYKDGYIFLASKNSTVDLLEKINIRLVAETPTEAANFNNCDGNPCFSDDDVYPITEWMWEYMKEHIVKTLLLKSQLPNDDLNDSTNDVQKAQPSGQKQR